MKRQGICCILALCLLIGMLPGTILRISAVETMKASDQLIEVTKRMEGFAAYPYWDYTQWTVGYGTKCPDDKLEEYKKNGITEEIAVELLHEEMKIFEKEVNDFAKKYNLTFNQHQFDALVSLSYNCGGNWTREENGWLSLAVRSGDMGNDLIYAMSLHSKAHTDYVLIKRRLSEANMYINGEYKAYNKDKDSYPSTYKYVFLDGNGGEVTYAIHGYDAADPMSVVTSFSKIPTGVDEAGNAFVYTFDGWYTASTGGTKVEKLDGSLANGAMLYAQWKDPSGQTVELPKGDVVDNVMVKVTGNSINIRSGPGSYYAKLGTLTKGSEVTITQTYTTNGTLWGKFDGGWISLAYTNFQEASQKPEPEPQWPRDGVVNGTEVNVRSGPGTSNDVQYQLNTGDPVTIHESFDDGELVWGKLTDGNWICLTYVTFTDDGGGEEEDPPQVTPPTMTGITLLSAPSRTDYVQMQDYINPSGSVLQIHYSDGSAEAMTLTRSMITGYSNAQLGETVVTVSYKGFETTFTVNIIKATVTFLNYDGSLLSQAQYAYGEIVEIPEPVMKPADEAGEYEFIGWDREVTACNGNDTYTAVFQLKLPEPVVPPYTPGDFDGNEVVDENDADYLLGYLLFPEWYPIGIPADLDGNGTVDEDDADYLLGYLLFPEWYPLTPAEG